MAKENIYVGGSCYNPPMMTQVELKVSKSIMATSMVEGGASITNWIDDGNDVAEY